ncbi:MAG: DUF3108 domain-containing protein [Burkholderiales bacterium]
MRAAATRHQADQSPIPFRKRRFGAYARYVFAAALALSLLLHLSLLTTGLHFYLPHDTQRTDVIEARLEPLPPLPKKVSVHSAPPSGKRAPPAKKKAHARSSRHSASHKTHASIPHEPVTAIPSPDPDKVADSGSAIPVPVMTAPSAQVSQPAATQASAEPAQPAAQNAVTPSQAGDTTENSSGTGTDATESAAKKLPDKFEIQYKVVKGIDGFPLGRATYLWVAQDGQYTLTSITKGSGLFALFQPGKLVQISHGKINAAGLAPEDFWIQRGRSTPDKTTSAHFDYINRNVTITKDNRAFSVPMEDNAQDLLSAIFQLAVRAPFPGTMLLHVTSGKSLKPYHARIVGEETIDTPMGQLRTLHLVRPAEEDEDAMDLWLAEDYNNIPVKIRIDHNKFGIIEQVVTGMQTH